MPLLKEGDVNLVVGTYMVPEVFPELGNIYADGSKIIHIDQNAYEIGKNHRVDLGMVADPKQALTALIEVIKPLQTPSQIEAAKDTINKAGKESAENNEKALEEDRRNFGSQPLFMSEFLEALARYIPENTIIFDEALTNSPELTRYFPPSKPGTFFQTRGGSLGVGIPGAIGLKLAHPDKTVIGFTGDGGSMYTIQALWTAARHNTDAKFIICNNGCYHLLQLNIDAYWNERELEKHDHPICFDLSQPKIDFVKLAESMGVRARMVETSADILPVIEEMIAHKGPFLVDLMLNGDYNPKKIGVKCGQ